MARLTPSIKISTFLFLILSPLFGICQDSLSTHYKIFNTKTQKAASLDDIVHDMNKANVLFFGEEHNDSTGHQLEYILLKKMEERYPAKIALSMEMFETDCQTVLNEYLAGFIRDKNFETDARVWPNYDDYRHLVEFAKENKLPVIAANAPARYTNMVNRLGLNSLQQLDATGKSYLPPLPIDTATGPYLEKFDQIMGGHSAMPGMQMYQAQNLWDATMGWSIAKFIKTNHDYKVLHRNGGFHSEEKLGTAAQLLHYYPKAKIINIAVYSDDSFSNPDWSKFSKMGDYIILTDPKLPKTF
ncbi:ChaN family lipoprotein [Mucilaginibacter sp.]